MKRANRPEFFYKGDCTDPSVQVKIKQNFMDIMTSKFLPPIFCKNIPKKCNKDKLELYCGPLNAAEKRRKRQATMSVCHTYAIIYSVSLTFVASNVPEVLKRFRSKIEATSNHRFYGSRRKRREKKKREEREKIIHNVLY